MALVFYFKNTFEYLFKTDLHILQKVRVHMTEVQQSIALTNCNVF